LLWLTLDELRNGRADAHLRPASGGGKEVQPACRLKSRKQLAQQGANGFSETAAPCIAALARYLSSGISYELLAHRVEEAR
jgi:hypothetical protein